jgi:hypothetical protein
MEPMSEEVTGREAAQRDFLIHFSVGLTFGSKESVDLRRTARLGVLEKLGRTRTSVRKMHSTLRFNDGPFEFDCELFWLLVARNPTTGKKEVSRLTNIFFVCYFKF